MKKLLHTLLLFAVGLFAACQAPTSGGDVYLNDFLDDLTAQTDAGPAIRAALSHCARIRAARLILPGGELRIRPDLAVEKYQFISNNDEGLKRIAFDLVGLQDFTIEGADTKLLFTGFVSPFNLERCRNITIRNLSIGLFSSVNLSKTARQGFQSSPKAVKSYFHPYPSCGVILSPTEYFAAALPHVFSSEHAILTPSIITSKEINAAIVRATEKSSPICAATTYSSLFPDFKKGARSISSTLFFSGISAYCALATNAPFK